jgi:glycine betaine transporter
MDTQQVSFKAIRKGVFWPSYLAFSAIGALSFFAGAPFISTLEKTRDAIFAKLDWLFAYGTFVMVLICVAIYISPLAKIKIGGAHAVPLLTKTQWFAIALCTTVAAGIMFWATSEPLIHLYTPPVSKGIIPNSLEAQQFAIATLFHHWSITPSAIYTIPAMAFALAFYNLKQPFSLASIFAPILGARTQSYARLIDGICVFSLVAGMAASLGTGAMTISGAYENHFSPTLKPLLLGLLIAFLVICFTASATSGLMKGIRILSDLNVKMFLIMVLIIFVLGPTKAIITSSLSSFGYFLNNFVSMSTFTTSASGDPWPNSWSIFYWSSWLSWAPITAVFLGRISYGHTVRDFIHINLVAPAIFSCVWTGVFGASALYFDGVDGSLYQTLQKFGPNAVSYEMLNRFPLASILIILFVLITFLSYITAADSTTDAISSLCTRQTNGEPMAKGSNTVKIMWATTIGFVSWVLVSYSGIEGMKLLCCLGGLPALFLIIGATLSLIKMGVVDLRVASEAKPSQFGVVFEKE